MSALSLGDPMVTLVVASPAPGCGVSNRSAPDPKTSGDRGAEGGVRGACFLYGGALPEAAIGQRSDALIAAVESGRTGLQHSRRA